MSQLIHLERILDELKKCAKCGSCRSVCPVFAEHGTEKYVARGKIALVQAVVEGTLDLSDNLRSILDNCLLCLSCVENCSRDVPTDKIVKALRAEIHQRLSSEGKLPSKTLPENIPERSGLRYYFLPEDNSASLPLARPSFQEQTSEILEAPDAVDTVFFFTGCLISSVYPNMGEAAVRTLNALRVTVRIPKNQVCCGAPFQAAGDVQTARQLAKENIDILQKDHPVVVACAPGGHMLKHGYPELLAEEEVWREKAQHLAARTVDISEYLVDRIGLDAITPLIKHECTHPITYHAPCQLNRGMGVRTAPRKLLRLVCKDRFVESRNAQRCCGAGTVFGFVQPETSEKIRSRKMLDIVESGASEVATGCPACVLQLSRGLEQDENPIPVRHTIEILARAIYRGQTLISD